MLSDVFDQITQAFQAYGCPAALYLGPQFIEQHTSTLRIVFSQTEDEFSNQLVSAPQGTPGWSRQGINPRPIGTRSCGVSAELWAQAPTQRDPAAQYRADLAFLDALINTLVSALQAITSGIYQITGGAAAENNADAGRAGLGYVLKFSVLTPVFDAPWPKQQLAACSETWGEAPATAVVNVASQLGVPPVTVNDPTFHIPTP